MTLDRGGSSWPVTRPIVIDSFCIITENTLAKKNGNQLANYLSNEIENRIANKMATTMTNRTTSFLFVYRY